jgi:ATP-dependent Clp endopeptidase proteolytic subunit ClpP
MLQINIDPNIRYGKVDELIGNVPRVITVNKFNEEAAARFSLELQAAKNTGQPVIPVVIDSYGGEVYSVLSMIDSMRQITDVPIATIAKGKSMSCGAILFSQGTEGYRFMSPFATLMIHDVSSAAHGKTEEIKADARETDRLNDLIYTLMARGVGKEDSRYFWKLVQDRGRADWFLDANEAKSHNLANHVRLPSFKLKVSCDIQFG